MNPVSIVSSLIIIVGCFLPWLQVGALFANRGVDNPDGAIMLVAGIIAGAVGISNTSRKLAQHKWVFTVVGIIGVVVAFTDLVEVRERAEAAARGFAELSEYLGEKRNLSTSNFVGSGLYVVGAGSVLLFLCGVGVFASDAGEQVRDVVQNIAEEEITAPRFSKMELVETESDASAIPAPKTPEEIENEQYREKLVRLNSMIENQKQKIFSGGMTVEIKMLLADLVKSRHEGIHLLNSFQQLFRTNLVQELTKLNSSYAAARENVELFIEHGIVGKSFPHNRL